MRKLFLFIVFLFAVHFCIKAQEPFKNQGEQEKQWVEHLFSKKYSKYSIEKFKGRIVVLNETSIQYDTTVVRIYCSDSSLKLIFTSGLFYPAVFSKEIKTDTTKIKLSDTKEDHHINNNTATTALFEEDTISISNIQELNYLNSPAEIKRFSFWIYHKWLANPIIYFIELTNGTATEKTELSTFIRNAKLTFIKEGWLII